MGDRQFNANGKEENVVKAVLTAGLYANVIKIEKTQIKFHRTIEGGAFESTPQAKEYRLLIRREVQDAESRNGLTRVYIHPSSINFSEREYQYPFMVYVGEGSGCSVDNRDEHQQTLCARFHGSDSVCNLAVRRTHPNPAL